jgi:hypothetical protein
MNNYSLSPEKAENEALEGLVSGSNWFSWLSAAKVPSMIPHW